MKKIISLSVFILVFISLAVVSANAISSKDFESEYLAEYLSLSETKVIDHVVYYHLKATRFFDEHYKVVSYYDTAEARDTMTKINIVDSIDNIPVTEIKLGDRDNVSSPKLNNVTKIRFPKNLEIMGYGTFSALPNLKKYVIPDGVKTLDGFAYDCEFETIKIPESVRKIGKDSFKNCKNLKKLVMPGKERISIGEYALYGCDNLEVYSVEGEHICLYCCAFPHSANLKTLIIRGELYPDGDDFPTEFPKLEKLVLDNEWTVSIMNSYYPFFFGDLPETCKIYVNTAESKNIIKEAGFKGTVISKTTVKDVKTLKATPSKTSVRLKWSNVSDSTGYRLYLYNTKTKTYEKIATIKDGSRAYTVKSLKPGKNYTFAVKAFTKIADDNSWSKNFATVKVKTESSSKVFQKPAK